MSRESLTAERLRELINFDPATGLFSRHDGRVLRHVCRGYIIICVEGRTYRAHRLAWLYVHGVWPKEEIDHKDRDRANNAMANLREASRTQNKQNVPRKGYTYSKKDKIYRARIRTGGREISLGCYPTAEQARAAHVAAQIKYHGEYACLAEPVHQPEWRMQ